MTCKDCIHYNSISTLCDKYIYPEERKNKPCKYYENIIKLGRWEHGVCNRCAYDWGKDAPLADVPPYCPNCGVKMDLQRIWRESE